MKYSLVNDNYSNQKDFKTMSELINYLWTNVYIDLNKEISVFVYEEDKNDFLDIEEDYFYTIEISDYLYNVKQIKVKENDKMIFQNKLKRKTLKTSFVIYK